MKKKKVDHVKTKVWITKYALTTGIFSVMAELDEETPRMAVDDDPSRLVQLICYHKPDWWLTEGEAIERACSMRDSELGRLRRKLEKLKALQFLPQKT